MADAPQVVMSQTPPEAINQNQERSKEAYRQETAQPMSYFQSPPYSQSDSATLQQAPADPQHSSPQPQRKWYSRRTVWIMIFLVLLVIAAAIGGGVGGSNAVKNAKSNAESATTPLPSDSPNSPSGTSTQTAYAPLPPSAVPLVDNTCPADEKPVRSVQGDVYSCKKWTNCPGDDIMNIAAYTLEDCANACSSVNNVGGKKFLEGKNVTCEAAFMSQGMARMYNKFQNGNCWLKGAVSEKCLGSAADTTALLLCRGGNC